MKRYCTSLTRYRRRPTVEVRVGATAIGGANPVRVQSMTNTDTNDTAASAAQVRRIAEAGADLVRLTAQGRREAENLARIKASLKAQGCGVPLVADIHFVPEAAVIAAGNVDKVRINPGNFNDRGDNFSELLRVCRENSTALRIGVNHGSLSPAIMERYGDTPEGMVASAMEFLRKCRDAGFRDVVVSMKSSNVRVMVHACRLLAAEMEAAGMKYPLHLGVTEAGNDMEGRIKSAVGIGALLADGIGDTIRVSLTEKPENEIPVARTLAGYFEGRGNHAAIPGVEEGLYSPFEYRRRETDEICRVGGGVPVTGSEITPAMRELFWESDAGGVDNIPSGRIVILSTDNLNAPAAMRAFFLEMERAGKRNPVIIRRTYSESDFETLQIKAAADTGMLFIDGYGDGLWIENDDPSVSREDIDKMTLAILQAARVRFSKPEYIACPGCGRTLYNIEETLNKIKERTSGMVGVKIGVMGCIVNGPGEMADADYGYVGSGPGKVTLYKGREVVKRNIPEEEAIEELVELIASDHGRPSSRGEAG